MGRYEAPKVGDFLLHVETTRRNGARSRNARLSAIRSFFRFVAISEPAHLLRCVDQTVIALWLGHESVETTQVYIHADLRMKEKALSRIIAPDAKPRRYRPDDKLLAVLEAL
jgi:site-specific recombinase XerD